MAEDAKKQALDDLKKLIYNGKITKDVKVGDVNFSVSTMSVAEHLSVASESGLIEPPKDLIEMYKYLPILLKYCVKKVNGVILESVELEEVLKTSDPDTLLKIANAYWSLFAKEKEAETELKNISATPNQGLFGK